MHLIKTIRNTAFVFAVAGFASSASHAVPTFEHTGGGLSLLDEEVSFMQYHLLKGDADESQLGTDPGDWSTPGDLSFGQGTQLEGVNNDGDPVSGPAWTEISNDGSTIVMSASGAEAPHITHTFGAYSDQIDQTFSNESPGPDTQFGFVDGNLQPTFKLKGTEEAPFAYAIQAFGSDQNLIADIFARTDGSLMQNDSGAPEQLAATSVPVPTTLSLFGVALLALGFTARRGR
jgi:hypothetical protein